jgi:hypothetical protein
VRDHPILRPCRVEAFKFFSDPAFEKVHDVVGLYLVPPGRVLVLCVDDKPPIEAAQGTVPAFPMRPGATERPTHDCRRHGTVDLFAALDVKSGKVIGACEQRHRASSSAPSSTGSSGVYRLTSRCISCSTT